MPDLPPRLRDVLTDPDAPWSAPLSPEDADAMRGVLQGLPEEVVLAVLTALSDPERALWGRGVLRACELLQEAGGQVGGVAGHDVIEMTDADGMRFGLAVVAVPGPGPRWGSLPDLQRLCERLDRTFADRPYVLYVRRALPAEIDVDGIARAVSLWLSAVERGERHEKHAVYEDGDIAFELTLAEAGGGPSPRVLTVGPVDALERLASVDADVVELAVQLEESHGELPVVVSLATDEPWRLPRGYVEQLLYGTADHVCTDGEAYEAGFRPNGRSLFSDPVCRNLVGLWWTAPGPRSETIAHDNPWARLPLQLQLACRRFSPLTDSGEPPATGEVSLRWWSP